MKLTQLAAKPQLIKITIDELEITEKYGDEIEFWIHDRQPIEKFVKMASISGDNVGEIIEVVNTLILDEQGQPVLKQDEVLPTDVMMAVVNKVVERLGK